MEFAATLPPHLKVQGREKKVVLRRALRGWVPDEVLDAPKRGFRLLLDAWFRSELGDFSRDVLHDSRALGRGYFRERYVRELLDEHAAGVRDHSQASGRCCCSSSGTQEFVDRSSRPPAYLQWFEGRAVDRAHDLP